jgi:hypothetical protein
VQEQINQRIAEISSRVEPLNAKIADFLDHARARASRDGVLQDLGTGLRQERRGMVLAGREAAENTKEQAALAGLVAALTWEHPKERVADPIPWAPRVIIYPEEEERVMEKVLAGKWHTLPPEPELIGQQIANLREGWTKGVYLDMLRYEEARRQNPRADSWMLLAENPALSAHGFICQDGRRCPRKRARKEVRFWMGCTPLAASHWSKRGYR